MSESEAEELDDPWTVINSDVDTEDYKELSVNFDTKAPTYGALIDITAPSFVPWPKADTHDMELRNIVRYLSPSENGHVTRMDLINRIRTAVCKKWAQGKDYWAEVVPFGSFGTKLYLPDGDLDLVVLTNKPGRNGTLLSHLSALIRDEFALNKDILLITTAKVPLIKFTDKQTNMKVDISVGHASGIKSTEWLNSYFVTHPKKQLVARGLIMLLKLLLLNSGLNEPYTGGLGSYALSLMVLAFLEGNDCEQDGLCVDVLQSFLGFYAFNFSHTDTRIGYNVQKGFMFVEKKEQNDRLVVSDPTDLKSNNAARAASRFGQVKQLFAASYEYLEANSDDQLLLVKLFKLPQSLISMNETLLRPDYRKPNPPKLPALETIKELVELSMKRNKPQGVRKKWRESSFSPRDRPKKKRRRQ